MKNSGNRRLRMYFRISSVLFKYRHVWKGTESEPYMDDFNYFTKEICEAISSSKRSLDEDYRNYWEARDLAADHILFFLEKLESIAIYNDDLPLYQSIHITPKKLQRLSRNKIVEYCECFLSFVDRNAAKLIKMGSTEDNIESLRMSVIQIKTSLFFIDFLSKQKRIAKNNKYLFSDYLKDSLLNIDAYMREDFKLSNPDFYQDFIRMRRYWVPGEIEYSDNNFELIVFPFDLEKIAQEEHLLDTEEVRQKDLEVPPLEAVSDENGYFSFDDMPEGVYRIEINHPGYKPLRKMIVIVEGQPLDIQFAMEKE